MHRSNNSSQKGKNPSYGNKRSRDELTEEKVDHRPADESKSFQNQSSSLGGGTTLGNDHSMDGGSGDESDDNERLGGKADGGESGEGNASDGSHSSAGQHDMFNKFRREKRLAMNRASARARRKKKKVMLDSLTKQVTELTKKNQVLQSTNETLNTKVESLESSLSKAQETISSLLEATARQQIVGATAGSAESSSSLYQGLLGNISTSGLVGGAGAGTTGRIGGSAGETGTSLGAPGAGSAANDPFHSLLLRGARGSPSSSAAAMANRLNTGTASGASGVGAAAAVAAASLAGDPFYNAALQQQQKQQQQQQQQQQRAQQMLALRAAVGQQQQHQPLEATGLGSLSSSLLPSFQHHQQQLPVGFGASGSGLPDDTISSLLLRSSGQVPHEFLAGGRLSQFRSSSDSGHGGSGGDQSLAVRGRRIPRPGQQLLNELKSQQDQQLQQQAEKQSRKKAGMP